jgi:hypothetical protein
MLETPRPLWGVLLSWPLFRSILILFLINSKFFGQPNGTKPPAKQSKLAFSSKTAAKKDPPSSGSSKENENIEMKDEESETETKPKAKKEEAVYDKEDAKPERGVCCHKLY